MTIDVTDFKKLFGEMLNYSRVAPHLVKVNEKGFMEIINLISI